MRRELQATAAGLTVTIVLACGCGEAPTEAVPSIPVAQPEQPASAQPGVEEPLTEADVETFLAVVQSLPGRRVPPLKARSLDVSGTDESPQALAEAWRAEFRRRFDPGYHASLWADDRSLQSVLDRYNLTAADFASLVMRISFAMTSLALQSRLDVGALAERSDRQLQQVIRKLEELDRAAQADSANAPLIRHRREQSTRALAEVVAVSEFGRLLQRVPDESRAVIARYREALNAVLPPEANLAQFERALDSQSDIVPAGYEAPAGEAHSRY